MNCINNKTILSICIPTFDRGDHVFELVNDLLCIPNYDFEVVILDNCSNDNTSSLILSINDNRLVYFRNSINIGGLSNIIKIFHHARGLYSLLCLDRDKINSNHLLFLIETLRNNNNIVFGNITDDSMLNMSFVIRDSGFDSVYNMAYLSKHPTGSFYKTEVLTNLELFKNIGTKRLTFPFFLELLNAELSFEGKSMIIYCPLILAGFDKGKEDFKINKSHTYKSEDDLYFFPANRILEFSIYWRNASALNISHRQKFEIIYSIYFRGLLFSTIVYRRNLMDPDLCSHYFIQTRNVNYYELLKTSYHFAVAFFREKLAVNWLVKIVVVLRVYFRIIYLLVWKH